MTDPTSFGPPPAANLAQRPTQAPASAPHAEPWAPLRMLLFLVRRVIVDPIREGRLRDTGWPKGLRAIAAVGLVLYVLSVLLAVFAQPVRARTDLVLQVDVTVPLMAMPVLVTILLFALSCLFTAALHMVWGVRLLVTLITVAVLVAPISTSDGWQITDVIPAVGATLLVGLVAARWRARFASWEFVASLVVIGASVVVPFLVESQESIPALRPSIMYGGALQVFAVLWMLAVPVAFLAGSAMAELTASTVTWTVTTIWQGLNVWRRRILPFGIAFMVLLVAFVIGRIVWHMDRGDAGYTWAAMAAGLPYPVLSLVLCGLVARRADRASRDPVVVRPDPDDIPAGWGSGAPIVALILAVGILGTTFASSLLGAFGLTEPLAWVVDTASSRTGSIIRSFASALVALGAAVWLSGRGQRIVPMGLAGFAGLLMTDVLLTRFGIYWSYTGVTATLAIAAIAVLVWLAVRRILTAERAMALITVLLLVVAFDYRDVVFEPFTALIGLAGVGSALMVGLIWRLLTDNGYTRGDSRRFPQPGRVLVALANATFGVGVLALDALMGGGWIGDLSVFEGAGDRYLGVSLFLVVAYSALAVALRGRVVRGPAHDNRPDDEGNQFPTVRGDELWHTGWER